MGTRRIVGGGGTTGGGGSGAAPPTGPSGLDLSLSIAQALRDAAEARRTVLVKNPTDNGDAGVGGLRFVGDVVESVVYDPAEDVVVVTMAGLVRSSSYMDFGTREVSF